MIDNIVGSNGSRFIIAAGAVALGLLLLVVVLRMIKNRPSSPFLRGGKNRQPRLAVLDAAAIDTRRRLVLVRRDDVEHLIMIGGPTDVVIESRIVPSAQPAALSSPPAVQIGQTAPQPNSTSAKILPDASVLRSTPERRPVVSPETKLPPVSSMGQALYGETANVPAPRPDQPSPVRPKSEPVPAPRPPAAERPQTVQAQPRPQQQIPDAPPSVKPETARLPEDIFEAARNRVLTPTQLAPAHLAPAQRAVTQSGALTTSSPQISAPSPEARKETSSQEFERILDAEITGDLGRLSAGDVRSDTEKRTDPAAPALRQDPRLGTVGQTTRTEPTLEEEMNRMLGEIAGNRKS